MDKNIIKNHLSKRFLSEETTPGIAMSKKINGENGKINKDGVKAVAKDSLKYNEDLKQDKDTSKMPTNKYNYTNDAEKTYHEEMEILNGQEMIKYTSEPGKEFSQRAKESIEGSSRMGNKGGKDMGNAEETWGASSDDFGKKLVDRIKASERKRAIADAPIDSLTSLGDKIAYPNDKVSVTPDKTAMSGGDGKNNKGDKTPQTKSINTKTSVKTVKESVDQNKKENNDNKNLQITESMKRLKFNKNGDKPFQGVNLTQKLGHALTLIPEGYKVDKKEFEMTDGNLTCKIRWEGNLSEGKAVVLLASDKTLINEDMNRMKALMGYKSQDTLGLVKGKARLDENAAFSDIWNKTKKLIEESDEIEDVTAKEGDLDDAVSVAPEATEHIEGTTSTDKGTKAPEPKKGEWEKNVKGQAPEAKKHIEGTASTDKGTKAPAPKEGEWEKIKKNAPEAKKDIQLNENEGEEDDDAPEIEDDFLKPSAEDKEDTEISEPSPKDIKKTEIPVASSDDEDEVTVPTPKDAPKLMKSASSGDLYIMVGKNATLVTAKYAEMAQKNKKNPEMLRSILTKMQDDVDFSEPEEQPLDEYGDEHPIPTSDAVKTIKTQKPEKPTTPVITK